MCCRSTCYNGVANEELALVASYFVEGRKMKILIVDDNESSRLLLQIYLSDFGTLMMANDGVEAVGVFKEALEAGERFDFIFLDYHMPKMDGFKTLEVIRKIESECQTAWTDRVRVIMISVIGNESLTKKALANGCDAYIIRPCCKDQFIQQIHNIGLLPQTAI